MNKLRLILAVPLLLVTLQGGWYFLGMRHSGIRPWLMFNACAVANITFLIGLVVFLCSGSRIIMYLAVLPLFFFGTGGLFVFPWSGMNIIAQVSHLLMTANLGLMLFDLFKLKDFRAAAIGLLLGSFIFSWFLAVQQNYVSSHPREMKELLGLDRILWNRQQQETNR
jgi:hypothetical protein